MKSRYKTRLQLGLQVDHQVAAAQQVQPCERRILDHVLHRKHHHLADLLLHPQAGLVPGEKAPQPLGCEVLRDVGRIDPAAGAGDGVVVQVGGVELDLELGPRRVHVFAQQHGDGIGILAAGAARHPGAKHVILAFVLEQHRQDIELECDKGFRVAKEARHIDQQFLEQRLQLRGVLLQIAGIDLGVVDVVLCHAPLDAPPDGAFLVLRKIVPCGRAQLQQDVVQAAGRSAGHWHLLQHGELADACLQGFWHPACGQHLGRVAALYRTRWHAVEFGAGRLLHQCDAASAQDRTGAQRAVGARARQDDAHGVLPLVLRQRAQEGVDRHALPARLLGHAQLQAAMEDHHVAIGRNDVHMVRLHCHLILGFEHRHGGAALQDFCQDAGVAGVQMRHQHVGHAAVAGGMVKELLEGFESAGRSPDADDGEALA